MTNLQFWYDLLYNRIIIVISLQGGKMMKKVKKAICAALVAGMLLPAISSSAFAAEGTWKHNSKGWWYSYAGGDYAKSTWLKDGGKW